MKIKEESSGWQRAGPRNVRPRGPSPAAPVAVQAVVSAAVPLRPPLVSRTAAALLAALQLPLIAVRQCRQHHSPRRPAAPLCPHPVLRPEGRAGCASAPPATVRCAPPPRGVRAVRSPQLGGGPDLSVRAAVPSAGLKDQMSKARQLAQPQPPLT